MTILSRDRSLLVWPLREDALELDESDEPLSDALESDEPEPDELDRFRFCKLLLFGNENEIGLRGGGGGGEA